MYMGDVGDYGVGMESGMESTLVYSSVKLQMGLDEFANTRSSSSPKTFVPSRRSLVENA